MSKTHMPGANRTIQYWAGRFVGSKMNTNCACIHTTETSTWPGYSGGSSAPHLTILPNIKARTVSMHQHFPADRSSRALVNLSGGVETNTLNVFQIELIGTCDPKYRVSRREWGRAGVDYIYWPDAPDWLLKAIAPVFQWLDAEWAHFEVVDAAPRGWVQYPASYGTGARQRMSFAEWRGAYGIFGHQHVPENTHGDPGAFPIDRLVAAINNITPEEDMNIRDFWQHLIPSRVPDKNLGRGLPAEDYLAYTNRDVRQLVTDFPQLEAKVDGLDAKITEALDLLKGESGKA